MAAVWKGGGGLETSVQTGRSKQEASEPEVSGVAEGQPSVGS